MGRLKVFLHFAVVFAGMGDLGSFRRYGRLGRVWRRVFVKLLLVCGANFAFSICKARSGIFPYFLQVWVRCFSDVLRWRRHVSSGSRERFLQFYEMYGGSLESFCLSLKFSQV